MLSPTWSPDGAAIAFSALAGGFTDLYLSSWPTARCGSSPTMRLPICSRRGRTTAARSRSSPNATRATSTLRFGRPQLAFMDVDTQTVRPRRCERQRPVEPAMVARRSGAVFRRRHRRRHERLSHRPGFGGAAAMTNVDTGVSGITPTSPALSVSDDAPRSPSPSTNAAGRSSSCSMRRRARRTPWRRLRDHGASIRPADRNRTLASSIGAGRLSDTGLPDSAGIVQSRLFVEAVTRETSASRTSAPAAARSARLCAAAAR